DDGLENAPLDRKRPEGCSAAVPALRSCVVNSGQGRTPPSAAPPTVTMRASLTRGEQERPGASRRPAPLEQAAPGAAATPRAQGADDAGPRRSWWNAGPHRSDAGRAAVTKRVGRFFQDLALAGGATAAATGLAWKLQPPSAPLGSPFFLLAIL